MSTITKSLPIVETIAVEEIVDLDKPLTLSDAMRAGSRHTSRAENWGHDDNVCALTAACLAATAWGFNE